MFLYVKNLSLLPQHSHHSQRLDCCSCLILFCPSDRDHCWLRFQCATGVASRVAQGAAPALVVRFTVVRAVKAPYLAQIVPSARWATILECLCRFGLCRTGRMRPAQSLKASLATTRPFSSAVTPIPRNSACNYAGILECAMHGHGTGG